MGFVPFCSLSIIPWIFGGVIAENSIFILLFYSAIILSFLGGMSWGWSDNSYSQELNLLYGIGFSLFSCLILFAAFKNHMLSLCLCFIGFNAFYYFESKSDILFDQNIEYKELRKNLTVLVSICFLVTIAYIVNPYS
tara:strand:- start:29 stop:439 length:411 start_codon:yes stop_codon:yes gene_type:complete